MKKLLAVFLVTMVVGSVFAVGSVRLGGTFGFDTGTSTTPTATDWEDMKYKQNGFGFSVGCDYEIDRNVDFYTDFTMLFTNGFEIKYEGADEYVNLFDLAETMLDEVNKTKKLNYSITAGAVYNLGSNSPFNFKVGGGLYFEKLINHVQGKSGTSEIEENYEYFNLGLSAIAEADYEFSDSIGMYLSAMPRLGLYNGVTIKETVDGTAADPDTNNAFKVGFSMPISVGITYIF